MRHSEQEKLISGCSVAGIMNESGRKISGEAIIRSIAVMRERSNGLGGGFSAYGIYPKFKNYFAFHMMYDDKKAMADAEGYLKTNYRVVKSEEIPTIEDKSIKNRPLLWRYFVELKDKVKNLYYDLTEEDIVVNDVMKINAEIEGAFVTSSGKNMGIFKGIGYPEDIGRYYKLEEYRAYIWIAHGRFPTNSVGWWGGAHPFGLLNWSVVHNGEISSYGINKRYLENFGYRCSLFTDTEVILYLFDLLVRKHKLPFDIVCKIIDAPLWEEIDRNGDDEERELLKTLRIIYSSALINGPFSIIISDGNIMMGLNDRVKLRPLVSLKDGDTVYMATEECAIREVCKSKKEIYYSKSSEPIIGKLKN
ncbi:glutamine amidotransferase family protein [bacterium]|nr:glutamine amidotransferase family protein [bacterium]